jgi:hypothetical protein
MGYQPTRANANPKPPKTGRTGMTNCPNCDAILSYDGGLHCDYCGAMFERPRRDYAMKVHSPDVDETVIRDWARTIVMTIN